MGPVAQDFRAIFGLGEDERTIATVDADGVALAAIQGLHRKLEAERDALKAENAALRAESAELRSRLERLEALVAGRASEER
jgi:cell division protein FtsB